ncbi:hypothetical protein H4R34_000345 [Dimargaris verticillata]|uniref:Rhodanese domain-containing protein n=1 Tax=Dimargaris verticillata TaxID=2761393 RepID=A0A9W8EER9_9FUNG|nr:hypothetical protein H4R34_000345 [Dimargaris verticillata]
MAFFTSTRSALTRAHLSGVARLTWATTNVQRSLTTGTNPRLVQATFRLFKDHGESHGPGLVTYDELRALIHRLPSAAAGTQPCSSTPYVLVDVREPDEIAGTGSIPTSHMVPVGQVQDALALPEKDFEHRYHFTKPSPTDQVIFYCRSGVRAGKAADIAKQLGFANAKNYRGSWLEYASKALGEA